MQLFIKENSGTILKSYGTKLNILKSYKQNYECIRLDIHYYKWN